MRLSRRDWATAGSIQPAAGSTTWASTLPECRCQQPGSGSIATKFEIVWNLDFYFLCGCFFLTGFVSLWVFFLSCWGFSAFRLQGGNLPKWKAETRWGGGLLPHSRTTTTTALWLVFFSFFIFLKFPKSQLAHNHNYLILYITDLSLS